MKQIINASGDLVTGLYRDSNGAIIVSDDKKNSEYVRQKNLNNRIQVLEDKLENIETSLVSILELLQRNLIK